MNKIVCNLCGTSYPDTEAQCPICGTAKSDSNKSTTGGEAGYAYVKGGRFSKANVRKRNAGQKDLPRVVAPVKPKKEAPVAKPEKKPAPEKKSAPEKAPEQQPEQQKTNEQTDSRKSNILLMLIALLLVIAIISVCVYIVKEYFLDDKPAVPNTGTKPSASTTAGQVPCTGLRLSVMDYTFTTAGESMMISVKPTPANTTDAIRYVSSDEQVATVDDKGIVTAVSNGTATITVYCGDQSAEFAVTCELPVEPTVPDVVLELTCTTCELSGYGATENLYEGELDVTAITWTSSDETVVKVKDGVVTAVGNGAATVIAEYMGQVVTCSVQCVDVAANEYELRTRYGSGEDFTISVGDTIDLYLIDKISGLRIQGEDMTFTMNKEGVITINSKGRITAVATGRVIVTVTYGDQTFQATVRVSK